jgi:hypothetical protein
LFSALSTKDINRKEKNVDYISWPQKAESRKAPQEGEEGDIGARQRMLSIFQCWQWCYKLLLDMNFIA